MKRLFLFHKVHVFCTFLIIVFITGSCATSQNVQYIQDVADDYSRHISRQAEVKICPDDLLSITVNSKDAELAAPFNMPVVSYQIGASAASQPRVLGYLVDPEGNIDFPLLGAIRAEGCTRTELTGIIKEKLIASGLLKDPIVTIQFLNFRVSVLGEVSRPGSFVVNDGRVTLLEALSMAGDMTIYGQRDKVAVIREENGMRTVARLDLRSGEIFDSPFFYLQQNDVVYVEPNKARAGQSRINQNNSAGVWLSGVSIAASITSIIINLLK